MPINQIPQTAQTHLDLTRGLHWKAEQAWLGDPLLLKQLALFFLLPWGVLTLALALSTRFWVWGLTWLLALILLFTFAVLLHLAVGKSYHLSYKLDAKRIELDLRYEVKKPRIYAFLQRLVALFCKRPSCAGLAILLQRNPKQKIRWALIYDNRRSLLPKNALILHHGFFRQLLLKQCPVQLEELQQAIEVLIRRADPAQERL